MAIDISALKNISGFMAGSLIDLNSGMVMGTASSSKLDIAKASAGQAEAMQVLASVGLESSMFEDVLFTLVNHYHVIRPLTCNKSVFLYVVLDRSKANLGMARVEIKNVENDIKI